MGRSAKSFQRRSSKYIARASALVICEDSKSSKTYLEAAKKHFDVDAIVDVVHAGYTDPLGIVETAIQRASDFDIVYCVIDRDTHKNFDAAVAKAASAKKVELVISYPCFEFWLFLHFQFSRRAYQAGRQSPGEQMVGALKQLPEMSDYDKGAVVNLFTTLLPKLPTARENARRAIVDALEVEDMNPSTRMHELFDAFEAMTLSR